jgi:hypothetical protein
LAYVDSQRRQSPAMFSMGMEKEKEKEKEVDELEGLEEL